MIKKCRHCVGTRGRVVGGDGLGNADVCMGNRDTRVVQVNGMSTEFRGVSFVSFVDVCIVLEWGICRCKKHQPRGGAHESAAARIDSCCPPVPNDRLHSTTLASFVRARRRRRSSDRLHRAWPLRVASCRFVVSRSSEGTNKINHDGARAMSSPPIGGVVARARDRDRGRVSSPRDDRRDSRASRR